MRNCPDANAGLHKDYLNVCRLKVIRVQRSVQRFVLDWKQQAPHRPSASQAFVPLAFLAVKPVSLTERRATPWQPFLSVMSCACICSFTCANNSSHAPAAVSRVLKRDSTECGPVHHLPTTNPKIASRADSNSPCLPPTHRLNHRSRFLPAAS
ncbi:hypothetical protein SAMN05428977_102221 [Nitrosomonas sp. Nm166]|nr:hypothetical protein SAMN05428977_102221 [Nitrosomonas sp. Nm166]